MRCSWWVGYVDCSNKELKDLFGIGWMIDGVCVIIFYIYKSMPDLG